MGIVKVRVRVSWDIGDGKRRYLAFELTERILTQLKKNGQDIRMELKIPLSQSRK